MIVLLSPAKTLDYSPSNVAATKVPLFKNRTSDLVDILKTKSAKSIGKLMHISDKLANENYERYQNFSNSYTKKNSKASILAFKGDVYLGLEAENFSAKELSYAQETLRILSGLYGLLRPLDKMQPYRLEMGTKMKNKKGQDLYKFWGDDITDVINKDLSKQKSQTIINLASKEYFKAVNKKKLEGDIIDIGFKEYRNGKLTFVSFNAKKARGMMARYIVKNKVEKAKDLQGFDYDGYSFETELSNDQFYMFVK